MTNTLALHEERAQHGILEFAEEMQIIRDGNLYPGAKQEPDAWKTYCKGRWGLSHSRVDGRINSGDTGHARVEYGKIKARGGPRAGQEIVGWHAMNLRRHHLAMDQADEHSAFVEIGVRRSRLIRFAQAHGVVGAELVVESIEKRLGLSIEAMSEADLKSFEELLAE